MTNFGASDVGPLGYVTIGLFSYIVGLILRYSNVRQMTLKHYNYSKTYQNTIRHTNEHKTINRRTRQMEKIYEIKDQ